jgi:glycerol-3-phosphate acyltransferase PlsY
LKAGEYFGRLVVLLLDFQGGDGITSCGVLLAAVCPLLHLVVLVGLLGTTTLLEKLSSHLYLGLPGSLIPSYSYNRLLYILHLFVIRLDLIIPMLLGDKLNSEL